jgi:hypothetical protein
MTSTTPITIVKLAVSQIENAMAVRSDDVPGLHLWIAEMADFKPTVESALKLLFKHNRSMDIEVVWASEPRAFPDVSGSMLDQVVIKEAA